jgi:hypothetical protein
VDEVEIGVSGWAVARQRDVAEEPKVTLFEMSRNGGACKHRNRLTAAIVMNAHSASWRQLGDHTDWK